MVRKGNESVTTIFSHLLRRLLIIAGPLFIPLLLSGCQESTARTDVLHFDQGLFVSQNIAANYNVPSNYPNESQQNLQQPVFIELKPKIAGGFLTYSTAKSESAPGSLSQKIQEAFANFPQKTAYENVIVLQQTDYKTADNMVFTYSNPGSLNPQFQNFDSQILQQLLQTNLVKDLGEVKEKSSWNNDAVKTLPQTFPKANFILLAVNKSAPDELINALAHTLDNAAPKKTLIISFTTKVSAPDETYQEFFTDFVNEVIPAADIDRFDKLPVKEYATAKLLGYFLRYRGALALDENISNITTFNVWYQTGNPIKTSDKIFIVSFGDIMLGRVVRSLMDAHGMDFPFEKMDSNYLRVNDLLLANLEGPVSKNSVRTTTGMSFGFFPDVVPVLKKHFIDIVSQANNHTRDKKVSGWEESMTLIRNGGILAFGNPSEITEDSIQKLSIRGQKLAFLGMQDVNSTIDDAKAVETVKSLVKDGYQVIPVIHWGIEYRHTPSDRQKNLAHKLIDAGAIAIIAHHPHVVETYENYNGHPIFYSLGNAIFDQYWSAETQVGLSIGMEISPNETKTFLMPIKLPKSQFELMDKDQKEGFLKTISDYDADVVKEEAKTGKVTTFFETPQDNT